MANPGHPAFGEGRLCGMQRAGRASQRKRAPPRRASWSAVHRDTIVVARAMWSERVAGWRKAVYSPSNRFSSPLLTRRWRSSAPPTKLPLTNTIGKVGQPAHIFNALRSRQRLR